MRQRDFGRQGKGQRGEAEQHCAAGRRFAPRRRKTERRPWRSARHRQPLPDHARRLNRLLGLNCMHRWSMVGCQDGPDDGCSDDIPVRLLGPARRSVFWRVMTCPAAEFFCRRDRERVRSSGVAASHLSRRLSSHCQDSSGGSPQSTSRMRLAMETASANSPLMPSAWPKSTKPASCTPRPAGMTNAR